MQYNSSLSGGKMKNRIDWDRHFHDWKASGLSKADYCRKSGVNRYSFYRKTAERENIGNNSFVELPFPIMSQMNGLTEEPKFEFHIELPFCFRFRINLKMGRNDK